jgi:hypothetical protein
MTTYTSTASIDCGKCHVPLQGPTNPKPDDILTCPKCGGNIRLDKALKQARELAKTALTKGLKDAFKKARF